MHFSQRLAVIVLTCGLSAGLVGCGFHLKGTNPSIAPVAYSKMSLAFPSNAEELEEKLSIHMGTAGVQLSNDPNAYVLRVLGLYATSLRTEWQTGRNLITFKCDVPY